MAAALGGQAGTREQRVSAVAVPLRHCGTLGSPPSDRGGGNVGQLAVSSALFRRRSAAAERPRRAAGTVYDNPLRAKCRRPTAADNAPLRPASAAASILCVPPRTTAPLCRAWPRTGFALGRPTCAATAPRALFAPSHPRRLLEPFEFRHYHRGGPCKPSIQGTLDDENFGLAGYLDA